MRNEKRRGEIDFPDLLMVLFIGLKLSGEIDWSWLWVVSPWWISILFGVLVKISEK